MISQGYRIAEFFNRLEELFYKLGYLCLLLSYRIDPDETIEFVDSNPSLRRVIRKYGDFSVKEE